MGDTRSRAEEIRRQIAESNPDAARFVDERAQEIARATMRGERSDAPPAESSSGPALTLPKNKL
jgi:hypothetical protein